MADRPEAVRPKGVQMINKVYRSGLAQSEHEFGVVPMSHSGLILATFQIFAFSHRLGHQRHFKQNPRTSASPPKPDVSLRRTTWRLSSPKSRRELTSAKLPELLGRKRDSP